MNREDREKQPKRKPWLALLLALALLVSVGTAGVLAYQKLATPKVDNSFTPAPSVDPIINESFAGNVKENVTVSVGDPGYSVYVRAAVVVTWQDAAGNVYVTPPVSGTDYSITYGAAWTEGSDGYWYYNAAVKSGGTTGDLIVKCEPLSKAPVDGYTLHVKIIAQTIQSAGTTDTGDIAAIQNAWKHSPPS